MVIGSYPCCDGGLMIPLPEKTPAWASEACPHCGAKVWHRLERVDPVSFTEADFAERYAVDEVAKTVTDRLVA